MISDRIAALRDLPEPRRSSVPNVVVTTRSHPVYYHPLTKCGCTYLRNVMFHLDHGAPIDTPDGRRHPAFDGDLSAGDVAPEVVREADTAFVVIRNPVYRFMSLYFDKFVSPEGVRPHREVHRYARQAGSDIHPGPDIEANRANCHKVLDHIETTLDTWPYPRANWHWKPQVVRLRAIRDLRFHVLTLDGIGWQLPHVLGPHVPGLGTSMEAVRVRNASAKFLGFDDVLNWKLRRRIRAIYAADFAMYSQVRRFWKNHPANPQGDTA